MLEFIFFAGIVYTAVTVCFIIGSLILKIPKADRLFEKIIRKTENENDG